MHYGNVSVSPQNKKTRLLYDIARTANAAYSFALVFTEDKNTVDLKNPHAVI